MYTIFDFDSTIITIEGLDTLAQIALTKHEHGDAIMQEINDITHKGMLGEIPFQTALDTRIQLLHADKDDVIKTQALIIDGISPSFIKHKDIIRQHKDRIYIISGGFDAFIFPVADFFGIARDHVFANDFVFDANNKIIGVDTSRLLSQNQGKAKTVQQLQIPGPITIVGDGFTDYEIKKLGCADTFIAYTETISRDNIVALADKVAGSFDDLSYFFV